jgi:two-component system sensor histidine kinase UhpB
MQEGLTNITKHAAATHVQLQLRQDALMVYGRLQDDGVGFAVDQVVNQSGPRGLGLLGMQERATLIGGSLQVESSYGQGTSVRALLPVQRQADHSRAAQTG